MPFAQPREKIHGAALANHLHRPLPAWLAARPLRSRRRRRARLRSTAARARTGSSISETSNAAIAPRRSAACAPGWRACRRRSRARGAPRKHANKFQADRAAADHHHRIARPDARLVNSAQHARQRLHHGRVDERNARREFRACSRRTIRPGNANVFGVSAVIEQQIFAQVRLALAAIEALDCTARNSPAPRACPCGRRRSRRCPLLPRRRQVRGRKARAAESCAREIPASRLSGRCRR